jgi:hypothetical protein
MLSCSCQTLQATDMRRCIGTRVCLLSYAQACTAICLCRHAILTIVRAIAYASRGSCMLSVDEILDIICRVSLGPLAQIVCCSCHVMHICHILCTAGAMPWYNPRSRAKTHSVGQPLLQLCTILTATTSSSWPSCRRLLPMA